MFNIEKTECECENIAHFEKNRTTPNGNPGHKYGQNFSKLHLVHAVTPYGYYNVCKDCAADCLLDIKNNPVRKKRAVKLPSLREINSAYRMKRARLTKAKTKSKKQVRAVKGLSTTANFFVQEKRGAAWVTLAIFTSKEKAVEYGKALKNLYSVKNYRIFW